MKILALDYGTKRIGIALSDETRTLATPRPFLPADPFRKLVESLKDLIRQEEVGLIIVGIPRNMDGSYGDAAKTLVDRPDRLGRQEEEPPLIGQGGGVDLVRRLSDEGNEPRAELIR